MSVRGCEILFCQTPLVIIINWEIVVTKPKVPNANPVETISSRSMLAQRSTLEARPRK